jgi:formylmethanofuran dehydrogenase subunit E
MAAYQAMPLEEMFTTAGVALRASLPGIVSRRGVRVACASCGEEIINEREVSRGGVQVCRTCADGGYYMTPAPALNPPVQE